MKLFPPLLSRARHLARAGPRRRAGRVSGGRRAHDRGHQPRVSAARRRRAATSIDKLEFLVLGRDRAAQPVQLKDVGYLQVGYDLRRGIADLDGTGEVVGGIAIMEQGRNVLAVTRALLAEARAAASRRCRTGIEIVPTYDRSALIWATLTNFFQALVYELIVVILVIARRAEEHPRRGRADLRAAARHAVHRAAAAAFGQTINLFSLAGLAIAIGEMADATIVIVENCTAELAKRRDLDAGREDARRSSTRRRR